MSPPLGINSPEESEASVPYTWVLFPIPQAAQLLGQSLRKTEQLASLHTMVRWIDGLKRSAPKQTPGTSSSLRWNSQHTPHPRASLANKFYLPQRCLQSENGRNLPYMGACINIAQWLWGPSAPQPISLKCHWTHRPRVRAYQPTPGTLQTSQACTVGCRLPGMHT